MNDIDKQILELEARIEALKVKRDSVWPKIGDEYYSIYDDGDISGHTGIWRDRKSDLDRKSIGNIFRTREEAEDRVKWMKAMTKLRSLVPDGWEPDWGNINQLKYSCIFRCSKNTWSTNSHLEISRSEVFFPTRESAEAAIEAMGDQMNDLLKGGW